MFILHLIYNQCGRFYFGLGSVMVSNGFVLLRLKIYNETNDITNISMKADGN